MSLLHKLFAFQKPDFTPDNLQNACRVKTFFVPLQCEMIENEVQKVPFYLPKA